MATETQNKLFVNTFACVDIPCVGGLTPSFVLSLVQCVAIYGITADGFLLVPRSRTTEQHAGMAFTDATSVVIRWSNWLIDC